MFIRVFDIFKIGVGPSLSHTMGPMTAAAAFLRAVRDGGGAFDPATLTGLEAQLYGSLAFTGKGHATDRAVILGLMGFEPASLDADAAEGRLAKMRATGRIAPPGLPEVAFDPERHVIFDYGPPLAMHANGMKLRALSNGAVLLEETYYLIGGGFIATESELLASRSRKSAPLGDQQRSLGYPCPFGRAAEMLRMGSESGRTVAEMKLANEETVRSPEAVRQGLAALHATMQNCIDRGLRTEGELPGGRSSAGPRQSMTA